MSERWTDLTPEQRAALLHAPIAIQVVGRSKSWGGSQIEREHTIYRTRKRWSSSRVSQMDGQPDLAEGNYYIEGED